MTIQLRVPGMACPKGYRFAYGGCGKTITKAIQSVDTSADVQTDPKSKQVKVETQAKEFSIREAMPSARLSQSLLLVILLLKLKT